MRSWLPVIIATLFIVAWALVIFHLIGDRPRDWDYGSTPYIPAQSYYTTQEPPVGRPAPDRQIPPLATPKEKPR